MTNGRLCLDFCATYYQNVGNWALFLCQHAMFPNFLWWSIGVTVSKILANVF